VFCTAALQNGFSNESSSYLNFLAVECWWKSHGVQYSSKPLFDIVLICVTGCSILGGTLEKKKKERGKKGKAWKSLSKT